MKVCARCGTQSADESTQCATCGAALPAPQDFKKTMLGFGAAPAAAPPAATPGTGQGPSFGRTMLGGVGTASPGAPAPPQGTNPPAGQPGSPSLGRTMLGGVGTQSPGSPVAPAPALGRTMLGGVSTEHTGPQAGPVPGRTLLGGVGTDNAASPAAPAPGRPLLGGASAEGGTPAPAPSAGAKPALNKTMMGFAAPESGPRGGPPAGAFPVARSADPLRGTLMVESPGTGQSGTPASLSGSTLASGGAPASAFAGAGGQPGTPAAPGEPSEGAAVPPNPSRTMLGVARPGIAPLNPGVAKANPSTPPAPPFDPYAAVGPPPAPPSPVDTGPAPQVRTALPKGAFVLLGVAVVLVAVAVGIALLWRGPKPLEAKATLGDKGEEQLTLSCEDCPDGTRIHLAGNVATIQGGKAQLPLAAPLRVGENKLAVAVERPGIGRDEQVDLVVPVEYRVRGDLSGLEEDPPRLLVRVEAAPGSQVVVAGETLKLDAQGHGVHAVDVTSELSGAADSVAHLDKSIPYSVQPPGQSPQTGKVEIKLPIAPLRIDAPGQRIVVDGENFMLTGRTLKDGKVTVAGRPITVDPEGRFSQLMSVSSEGQTTITVAAKGPDSAPRFAEIEVKRVANLGDEAKAFSEGALTDYAALVSRMNGTKRPRVALVGEVVESRVDNHTTLALLDVDNGCQTDSCLVRLVYGAKRELKTGDKVRAFGTLSGSVEGPRSGTHLPEVAVEFLLEPAR